MAILRNIRTPRLRCFVAMAFDHTDTDAIFTDVERILDEVNIDAIRVDRVVHNDDIDDRIISEITRADFVLADLSYARPSVYFEASFAQRTIPVIYTVRSDHFQPRIDDPNGNLRVHFDLQMKNIIGWKEVSDKTFRKRLRARVLKVVAPLREKKIANENARNNVTSFESKSRQEQREVLLATMRKYFTRDLRYRIVELMENSNESKAFIGVSVRVPFPGAMVGTKREGSTFRFVFFQVVPSITKTLSQEYRYFLLRHPLYGMEMFNSPKWTPQHLKEDIVICSYGARGNRLLAREILFLRRGRLEGTLECTQPTRIVHPRQAVELDREVTLHVIESTSCLADLGQQLKRRFD